MRDRSSFRVVVIHVAILLLLAIPAESTVYSFTEDFNTAQYKDTLSTTALWDTVAGELRLPPYLLTLLGSCDGPDLGMDVVTAGGYAYMAGWSGGLLVIDTSDPSAPFLAGSYDTPGLARGVDVSGNYAYVADHTDGFQIIDITDPAIPVLAASFATDRSYDVAVSGDHAYIADGAFGLKVIDISDPSSPSLAGSNATIRPNYVAVHGDYVFTSDGGTTSISVLDVSDPTNPLVIGSCSTPDAVYRLAVSGDYAYVGSQSGLLVVDINDPTNPSIAATFTADGNVHDASISGDFAYITVDSTGVIVVDISDPSNPARIAEHRLSEVPHYGVTVSGACAFVASGDSTLRILKIADPVSPLELAGSCNTGNANDVAISGNYAYVADGPYGLKVVDISDPVNPVVVRSFGTVGSAMGVALSGDHLCVAAWSGGFQMIDISDPLNPVSSGSCGTRRNLGKDVGVAGDYAYIADGDSGMTVIDISDPANPAVVGGCDTHDALGIFVGGNHAYVADYLSGLRVIDISDPLSPSIVGNYNTPDWAFEVAVEGDYAYVADRNTGILVIDISDPSIPVYTGGYNTPGNAFGVCAKGDFVCVADSYDGLQFLDVSNPANPVLVGSCDTPDQAIGVNASGDFAYLANRYAGLQVIQVLQRSMSMSDSIGQSVDVSQTADTVLCARLATAQTDTINWRISADGGGTWQAIMPDGSWNQMGSSGIDFRWRSEHIPGSVRSNPTCTSLQIDFMFDFPQIEAIEDVPNDQGRQVSISWLRSGHDHAGSQTPIVEYAVYRRIDHGLGAEAAFSLADAPEDARGSSHAAARPLLLYPPGDWHFVTTAPARAEDEYAVVVPTLADSTIAEGMYRTVFFVSAMTGTPGSYFDSPPDSGYSVDDLSPQVPLGFSVAYNASGGNDLSWEECPDADFQYFRIYRGESEEFEASEGSYVHGTVGTGWIDTVDDGWKYFYRVSAVDFSGNESDAAPPDVVTGEDIPTLPSTFALYQNAPNPFNPSTTIRFDLPRAVHVRLSVYNVKGELVSTVVDRNMSGGRKEIVWAAKDDRGRPVASGVYFYRLAAGEFVRTRKMVLLR